MEWLWKPRLSHVFAGLLGGKILPWEYDIFVAYSRWRYLEIEEWTYTYKHRVCLSKKPATIFENGMVRVRVNSKIRNSAPPRAMPLLFTRFHATAMATHCRQILFCLGRRSPKSSLDSQPVYVCLVWIGVCAYQSSIFLLSLRCFRNNVLQNDTVNEE